MVGEVMKGPVGRVRDGSSPRVFGLASLDLSATDLRNHCLGIVRYVIDERLPKAFRRKPSALAIKCTRRPEGMFIGIPIGFDQPAPIEIADELDHGPAWTAVFQERRRVRNGKLYSRNLSARDIAVVECIRDRPEPASFRRDINGQTKVFSDLL